MNYQRSIALALSLSLVSIAPVRSGNSSLDPGLKKALLEEISPELKPLGLKPEQQRVLVDYIDLNGDGERDALVILVGSNWCGSGGCTLKVFHGHDGHYHSVSTSTLIRTPIAVSDRKTNGWRDLIVEVSGGGISSRKVALKYDGKKYPANPSLQTPLTANSPIKGKVLFPDGSEPRPIR
jgi:hypothetical protein